VSNTAGGGIDLPIIWIKGRLVDDVIGFKPCAKTIEVSVNLKVVTDDEALEANIATPKSMSGAIFAAIKRVVAKFLRKRP
jgi:hypothetical protein